MKFKLVKDCSVYQGLHEDYPIIPAGTVLELEEVGEKACDHCMCYRQTKPAKVEGVRKDWSPENWSDYPRCACMPNCWRYELCDQHGVTCECRKPNLPAKVEEVPCLYTFDKHGTSYCEIHRQGNKPAKWKYPQRVCPHCQRSTELANENCGWCGKPPAKTERWRPKEGERYYFIYSDGVVDCSIFSPGERSNDARIALGNCYPVTHEGKKQAEAVAAKFRELFK